MSPTTHNRFDNGDSSTAYFPNPPRTDSTSIEDLQKLWIGQAVFTFGTVRSE